jgi:hypothetical protein
LAAPTGLLACCLDARGYVRLPWPTCLNAEQTANLKVLPDRPQT